MRKFLLLFFCSALIIPSTAQATNFIPAHWYVREVPFNTINGKIYPKERVPAGQPQEIWWLLDQGLGGFHLEPTSENANTKQFPSGEPQFTCNSVEGEAELENPLGGGEGIMRFTHMSYSACKQTGYCAVGETYGLEQQMPVQSSGVYITKGYAHSHDSFSFDVKCNGRIVSTVSGPPLNLFWNEQGAGTHEGAEPNIPLTDSPENNKRYWEPAAELGEVNELELGELTDSLSSKEMLIRGQMGYLGEPGIDGSEDVYTISSP